jgi:hypothetical protein
LAIKGVKTTLSYARRWARLPALQNQSGCACQQVGCSRLGFSAVEERRTHPLPTFDQVKDTIISQLSAQKLKELHDAAKIEIIDPISRNQRMPPLRNPRPFGSGGLRECQTSGIV